jgi:excisionase family DNA binding protein
VRAVAHRVGEEFPTFVKVFAVIALAAIDEERLAYAVDRTTLTRGGRGVSSVAIEITTREEIPMFLTVEETAALLRTTRKGIYAMVERGLLPRVTRIGRRILVRSSDLLDWLRQESAPSPKE